MGHYGDGAANLRLWQIARDFTLCDNFFMGAFGGSYLNHQYLIAARPSFYPDANTSPAKARITVLDGSDPKGIRPKQTSRSPASAMDGAVRFVPTTLTPDFWAVNTMLPPYAPSYNLDPARPGYADAANPNTLVPQYHETIGDMLTGKGVEWSWYAGGWAAALAGKGEDGEFPSRPNFQPHHQPFNYFSQFGPSTPERAKRLRDAGVGETARTNWSWRMPPPARCRRSATTSRKAISTSTPAIPMSIPATGTSPASWMRALQPAMAKDARRHHLRRKWRLVGSCRAAKGRSLGGRARAFRR